jgi:hypothetical protein
VRPFFRPSGRAPDRGTGQARSVRWGDLYCALVSAGFGTPGQLGRYTERQLRLFHQRFVAGADRRRADLIEAISMGYAGSRDGKAHSAMQSFMKALRDQP